MTLKEIIQDIEISKGMSDKIEQIADDYAIDFLKWIRWNVIEEEEGEGWEFDGKFYNDEQLLEIFKKEKGL